MKQSSVEGLHSLTVLTKSLSDKADSVYTSWSGAGIGGVAWGRGIKVINQITCGGVFIEM